MDAIGNKEMKNHTHLMDPKANKTHNYDFIDLKFSIMTAKHVKECRFLKLNKLKAQHQLFTCIIANSAIPASRSIIARKPRTARVLSGSRL